MAAIVTIGTQAHGLEIEIATRSRDAMVTVRHGDDMVCYGLNAEEIRATIDALSMVLALKNGGR
jgi:hypothetical protein